MISLIVPNILGTVILIHTTPSPSTRPYLIVAIYLMQFFGATGPSLTALVARNTAGSTKKSVSYAIVYTGWAVGNGVAPLLFTQAGAPRYIGTLRLHLALYVVWVGVALSLRWAIGRRRAEKRSLALRAGTGDGQDGPQPISGDLTDRQDRRFQYAL
jgi:hypothetical protein